jgi:hypothetical protein
MCATESIAFYDQHWAAEQQQGEGDRSSRFFDQAKKLSRAHV